MGLGKFLHNASRAAGKTVKHVTHDVSHMASSAVSSAAHAATQAASAAATGVGKGLQGATKGIGKVGIGKFNVGNLAKSATHVGIGKFNLNNASKELTKGIASVSHIPILGPIIGVSTGLPLVNAINSAARGERIDRAALGAINDTVKDYKEIGPYAASVIAFVPGVGPGVGGAINAGLALAEGKKWDDVAMAAARGAIPGGEIAKSVFDAAHAAAQGKPLDQIGLAALPLDDKAKSAIAAAVAVTKALASGKRVDQALLSQVGPLLSAAGMQGQAAQLIQAGAGMAKDAASGKKLKQMLLSHVGDAMKLAGPEVAKALQVGTAIGTAKKIQESVMKQIAHPAALSALENMGHNAIAKNKSLATGLQHLSKHPDFTKGFAVASGLMAGHKLNEATLLGARNALPAEAKKGFDSATSYLIGKQQALLKPIKGAGKIADPAHDFAYHVTHGLAGAGEQQKQVVLQKINDATATAPVMKTAVSDAVKNVVQNNQVKQFHTMSVPEKMKMFLLGRG